VRSLVLLAVLAGAYLALRWFLAQPQGARLRIGALLVGFGLIAAAATGRLPWVLGLIGGLLPLLVAARRASRQGQGAGADRQETSGQKSVVETRHLRMTLDHDTGEMIGRVLVGRFAGRDLHVLSQGQLLELLALYEQEDQESAALLRAYLDRVYGADWEDGAAHGDRAGGEAFGEMTRQEAYAILGLEEGAGEAEIREAHRRLIQKLHPDRGGSTFLAAKINQAKDFLLDKGYGST
jgi:hypothetical protein